MSNLSCAICYLSYENSTDICSTVCGHIFHDSCLRQWIIQYNKCPICNQLYPNPHRIFLDIDGVENTDNSKKQLIIKGLNKTQMEIPKQDLLQQIINKMKIGLTISNISSINRASQSSLICEFKSQEHCKMFLQNKYKLKRTEGFSRIRIYEKLSKKSEEIFNYSQKLNKNGYKIFVVSDKIFARKDKTSNPIKIESKKQVDDLQHEYECAVKLSTNNKFQHIAVKYDFVILLYFILFIITFLLVSKHQHNEN